MIRTVMGAIAVALVIASGATAHYGDLWFQTRSGMQENIEAKYQVMKMQTVCRPAPTAHWIQENGFTIRRYDHFVCAIWSTVTRRGCVVTAHQTGYLWSGVVLTGYYFAKGPSCTPTDLRRR